MYKYLETYESEKSHYIIPFQKFQKKKQYVIAVLTILSFIDLLIL